VSPVAWQGGRAQLIAPSSSTTTGQAEEAASSAATATPAPAAAAGADTAAPLRVESTSAYLVLYRRRHLTREDATKPWCNVHRALPKALSDVVGSSNSDLITDQAEFKKRSDAVQKFVGLRRRVVEHLISALREHAKGASVAGAAAPPLAVVPTAWLNGLLRGDDRSIQELLDGKHSLAPVRYWRALLRSRTKPNSQILDPLAIWCGEVKLMPSKAFEALRGLGGLDPSLFLPFSDAVDPEMCKAAWELHSHFQREWLQIRKIMSEGKVNVTERRQLQSSGRGNEAVWVANRLQRAWQKMLGANSAAAKAQPWELLALRAFLKEVHEARWGGRAPPEEVREEDPASKEDSVGSAVAPQTSAKAPSAPAGLNLTEGLVCSHGLIVNPKGGFLVKRAEIAKLLDISREKAKAYTAVWPHAHAVPRIRAGLGGQDVLGYDDMCLKCLAGNGSAASSAQPVCTQRKLLIKRRYASKVTRKVGAITIPDSDEPTTGKVLAGLLRDQLKLPVAKILRDVEGEEVELADAQPLEDDTETVIVEKDETEAPAREAAAFQGSIFRSGSAGSV